MPVTIKCHKKAGLHPLPRKMQFSKNHRGGGGQIDLPSPLGLRTALKNISFWYIQACVCVIPMFSCNYVNSVN